MSNFQPVAYDSLPGESAYSAKEAQDWTSLPPPPPLASEPQASTKPKAKSKNNKPQDNSGSQSKSKSKVKSKARAQSSQDFPAPKAENSQEQEGNETPCQGETLSKDLDLATQVKQLQAEVNLMKAESEIQPVQPKSQEESDTEGSDSCELQGILDALESDQSDSQGESDAGKDSDPVEQESDETGPESQSDGVSNLDSDDGSSDLDEDFGSDSEEA